MVGRGVQKAAAQASIKRPIAFHQMSRRRVTSHDNAPLDELIATVARLLETADERAPQIRADLDRLDRARKPLLRSRE